LSGASAHRRIGASAHFARDSVTQAIHARRI